MSILILNKPVPTGFGSTFVTVVTASTVLSFDPYHAGQYGGVVVDGEIGELEYVVLVDDEVSYLISETMKRKGKKLK